MATGRMLIVGGGIAGLTLRLAMRDSPWQVDLVERSAGWQQSGAGLAVQPNAMRVLRRLGVADAVERAGTVIGRFSYLDQGGRRLCVIDLDDLWSGVGPFVGISRAALHCVLRPGQDNCRAGISVTALTQREEQVLVWFCDGSAVGYDLVVGADGINSDVRRLGAGVLAPAYCGQMAWRSLAPVRPGSLDGIQFWLGEDRFFGLCPAGGDMTYGFGNLAGVWRHEPAAGRRDRLREHFAGFGPAVQEYLAAVPGDADVHCSPVECLPDIAWGRGRVVLIGDAAHAMSPMMGQGGCLAIEDALVLADELGGTTDVLSAIAAFTRRRRPRVTWVREQSQVLADLVRLPASVRDQALRSRGIAAFHDRYRPLIPEP